MNNAQELKAHLQDSNKARMYEAKKKKDNLKKYRVIKEFFVDAHDEYDAETKANEEKNYNDEIIDVQEVVDDEQREAININYIGSCNNVWLPMDKRRKEKK